MPAVNGISERLRKKAASSPARVLLPEGEDPRVREAALEAVREGVCRPVLLSGEALEGVETLNAADEALLLRGAGQWARIKGIPEASALPLMKNRLDLAAALLYGGEADAMVAGACHATADVLRPALALRRLYPGAPPVTSCFIMQAGGPENALIFADCGMNPDPSPAMLAQIAGAAAGAAAQLCGMEPRVAMLSFSTKGSADHPAAAKMRKAAELAAARFPDIAIDGEMQADAALVPWIGEKKAPGSRVAGKANVLVFPDLNSGNIAYKLVERLAGAKAIGPIVLGLDPAVYDLSRGCSAGDITDMCAVASIRRAAAGGARNTGRP